MNRIPSAHSYVYKRKSYKGIVSLTDIKWIMLFS
jgi:hypothetical protein